MSKLRSHVALALVLGVGSIGLAACGGGDDSGSATASTVGGAASSSSQTSGGAQASDAGSTASSAPAGPVGDVAVETWAGGVCGAVGTWLDGINANGTKLNQDVQGIQDL